MIRRPLFSILLLAVVLATISVLQTAPVSAAATNSNAQGLEISPALVELNGEKGKSYLIKLKVTNITPGDLAYTTSVEDFAAKDETGSPQILFDSNMPTTASIKTWLGGIKNFTLKTREAKELLINVTIPTNAEPGGHYGVVRFSGSSPEVTETGVGLSASTGLLLLVRVDGLITEKASLQEFFVTQNNKQSWIFETAPITFVTRIRNEGNIHVKPFGTIELRDVFGNVVTTMDVNKDKQNVLPASIRRFETSYNKDWMIGPYTATLALGYGSTGQAITGELTIWLVPYKPLLALLAIIVTLYFIFRRMLRRYAEKAVERAQNSRGSQKRRRR